MLIQSRPYDFTTIEQDNTAVKRMYENQPDTDVDTEAKVEDVTLSGEPLDGKELERLIEELPE